MGSFYFISINHREYICNNLPDNVKRSEVLRSLTKVPELSLVYFNSDKTTCILETKMLRDKGTQKPFTEIVPPVTTVILKHQGKELEGMVIGSDGKFLYHVSFFVFSFRLLSFGKFVYVIGFK